MDVISRRIEIDGLDIAIQNQQQLKDEIRQTTKALSEVSVGSVTYDQLNTRLQSLKEAQRENRTESRLLGKELVANGTVGVSAYRRLSAQLVASRSRLKDYAAQQALGIRLTKEQEEEFEDLTDQVRTYDSQLKQIDSSVGQNFRNVGNYASAIEGVQNRLIGAFSVQAVFNFGSQFIGQLQEIQQEARGIEFAFERVQGAQQALLSIQQSTRGLLSELDIKAAIVNFDNFNISLEETDTLMEFLAIRSTQTGVSIEKLQDSLVEGLSKESRLRIDNLGISAQALNEELEKTPNFVEAVANIARTEIAEAGDILDEAANSQQRLNVAYDNFLLSVVNGSGVITDAWNGLLDIGTDLLNTFRFVNDGRISNIFNFTRANTKALEDIDAQVLNTERQTLSLLDTNEKIDQFIKDGGFEVFIELYEAATFTTEQANEKATEFFKTLREGANPIEDVSSNLSKTTDEVDKLDKKVSQTVSPESGSLNALRKSISDINKEINNSNLSDNDLISRLQEIERLERSITDLEDNRRRLQSGDRTVSGVAAIGGIALPDSIDSNSLGEEDENRQVEIAKAGSEQLIKIKEDETEGIKDQLEKQRLAYLENANQVGEILGQLFSGNAETAKEGLKALGGFILDQLEKQILANIVSIQASAIKGAFIDPTALLRGAAQVAVVRGLFAAVKGRLLAERGALIDSKGNVQGKRHANGGENVNVNGRSVNVEQGERFMQDETGATVIINRMANSMNKNLLDSFGGVAPRRILSSINRSAGGVSFAERGMIIQQLAPRPSQDDIFAQFAGSLSGIGQQVRDGAREGSSEGTDSGLTRATQQNRKLNELTTQTNF